ncbi:MAG TPA: hypothetical protein DDY39_05365, partial [Nitrospira sp.]|nr:hypothetical protein [Nitrospira sp.]
MTTLGTVGRPASPYIRTLACLSLTAGTWVLTGCFSAPAVDRPILTQADDRRPIPEPQEETDGQWALWDGTDKMVFYRIGQL